MTVRQLSSDHWATPAEAAEILKMRDGLDVLAAVDGLAVEVVEDDRTVLLRRADLERVAAEGSTDREAADRLLSPRTAAKHIQSGMTDGEATASELAWAREFLGGER
jgi:hypothetical protein